MAVEWRLRPGVLGRIYGIDVEGAVAKPADKKQMYRIPQEDFLRYYKEKAKLWYNAEPQWQIINWGRIEAQAAPKHVDPEANMPDKLQCPHEKCGCHFTAENPCRGCMDEYHFDQAWVDEHKPTHDEVCQREDCPLCRGAGFFEQPNEDGDNCLVSCQWDGESQP